MITDKKTVLTEFVISENVQKIMSRKLFITGVIFVVAGAVGFLVCFIFMITSSASKNEFEITSTFWVASAFLLLFGGVLLFTVNKQVKNISKVSGVKNVYEFFSDCMIAKEVRDGEVTAVVRIAYGKIVKTKQTADVLFFYYQVKNMAYPINVKSLTDMELDTVKSLFGMDIKGRETIGLSASTEEDFKL